MQLKKIKISKPRKRLDKKSRLLLVVGFLIFISGVLIYAGNIYYNNLLNKQDEQKVENFLEDESKVDDIKVETDDDVQTNNESIPTSKYDYIGVLEIPKISVKRGFLNIEDSNNVVNKNIQVIDNSDMPDVVNGNLIIAAHSGSGRVAYFSNLYKMEISDTAYVYYNGVRYTYKITNIYDVEKTGTVTIQRDNTKTTLTLITCRHNTNKQIVVIAELTDKEEM